MATLTILAALIFLLTLARANTTIARRDHSPALETPGAGQPASGSPYRAAAERRSSAGPAPPPPAPPTRPPTQPARPTEGAAPPWQHDAERFITMQCRARGPGEHAAAARAGERVFEREPVPTLARQIALGWQRAGDHRRALAWRERAERGTGDRSIRAGDRSIRVEDPPILAKKWPLSVDFSRQAGP